MKKITTAVFLCLVAIIALTTLAGCFTSPENKFIGKWYFENEIEGERQGLKLELEKNGKGALIYQYREINSSVNIEWTVDNNRIFITNLTNEETIEFTYEFSSNGNKLTLTNVRDATLPLEFQKQ